MIGVTCAYAALHCSLANAAYKGSSVAANLGESDDGADDAEQVECEECEGAHHEVLEAVFTIDIHLSNGILHPIEEYWMRRFDVVCRLSLLHRKPEEWATVWTHEPQTCMCVWIVELTAAEV